jgi:hypothetical protein
MTEPGAEQLGPVDHLARHPLPWRAPHLTECGKPLDEIGPERIITRDAVRSRVNAVGKRRAAFSLCLTCLDTADRHPDNLIDALHREAGYVSREHQYASGGAWLSAARLEAMKVSERARYERDKARTELFLAEIEAVQALVAAHRAEFDRYIQGVGETESLADRRAARRARQARSPHPRSVL